MIAQSKHSRFVVFALAAAAAIGAFVFSDAARADVSFDLLHSFGVAPDVYSPYGELIQASDGALYGTTLLGGADNDGTIFRVRADGSGYTVLHSFARATEGGAPYAGLLQDSGGTLYGTTSRGGPLGAGTVFKMLPDGSGFTVLANTASYAGLIQASDGALYGTSYGGHGSVFKILPDGSGFTILHAFSGFEDGDQPYAGLIQGREGVLYGTTSAGGVAGSGTAFKILPDGSGFTVLHSFPFVGGDGATPTGGLIQGSDGTLYGTTTAGGVGARGTIFKMLPNGDEYTILHSFAGADGAAPYSGLIQGSDGALYGTTSEGLGNGGTIFKLLPDGSGFTLLRRFSGYPDGYASRAGLMQAKDGALYGANSSGGVNAGGTMFKMFPDGSGFTVVHSFMFTAPDGTRPSTGLTLTSDAALYGTTLRGGGMGFFATIFRTLPDGSGHGVVFRFSQANDRSPIGELIQGSDGTLYGATGAGTFSHVACVFSITPGGGGFTNLHCWAASLEEPSGGLLQAADGLLYGMTRPGRFGTHGTVFKIRPDGTDFTVIHVFDDGAGEGALIEGSDGALYGSNGGAVFKILPDGSGYSVLHRFAFGTEGDGPAFGLIQASDGALYGTARAGGVGNGGTVFRILPDGSGFTVLHSFTGGIDGSTPSGRLTQGSDGALYGMTRAGGVTDGGTVFKVLPDGSGYAVLHSFTGDMDGIIFGSRLVQTSDGVLYGTTPQGGARNEGTIFKILPDGSGYGIVHDFPFLRDSDGDLPYAGLVQAGDGALYGTTFSGGAPGNRGAVVKVFPDGSGYALLHSFSPGSDGYNPSAGLIQGGDGVLYGTTVSGGFGSSNDGTVFKMLPDGSGYAILHSFTMATEGDAPAAGLIQGSDGTLYGTTTHGGINGGGTVFKMFPDGSGFTVLHAFTLGGGTGGYRSFAGLVLGSDGTLYGTTSLGGMGGGGTVFRVLPDGSGFTVLHSFTDGSLTDGARSFGGLTQAGDGALYGTTTAGGDNDVGTVFKILPDGSGFTIVHSFTGGTDGAGPYSALIQGSDGFLYGTTSYGGDGTGGTAFQMVPDDSDFTVLHSFLGGGMDGYASYAGLIQGADGALYGTTAYGGDGNRGTMFRLSPAGSQ